jgi:hypothetical protein
MDSMNKKSNSFETIMNGMANNKSMRTSPGCPVGLDGVRSECPICENYRYLIVHDMPVPCHKCNWRRQFQVKEQWVCLGCGNPEPCASDCPAGRAKNLVKQD